MAFNIVHWLKSFTDERSNWSCQYRMVALAMARHADAKTGSCYPSIRLLEREANVSKHTVIRALRLLEKDGWCTRDTTHGQASRYKLVSDVHRYPACTGALQTPVSVVHLTGAPGTPVGGAPQTHEQPSTNKPSNNPPTEETVAFIPRDWPEWILTLRTCEGWQPDDRKDQALIDWLVVRHIEPERAETVALEMKAKAGMKRPGNIKQHQYEYSDPRANFQVWVKRPPLSANARNNGHAVVEEKDSAGLDKWQREAIELGFDPNR